MAIVVLLLAAITEAMTIVLVLQGGGGWGLAFIAAQGAGCVAVLLLALWLSARQTVQPNEQMAASLRVTD